MVERKRLGIEAQVGDRFRMRSQSQMTSDAILALTFRPLSTQVPPGVVVKVTARSENTIYIQQYHGGLLYGPVIGFQPMLFEAWFRPEK